MKQLTQETLNKVVAQTTNNKNIHGSVFHIESGDKSISLFSASGNISSDSQYYIASINKLYIKRDRLVHFDFQKIGILRSIFFSSHHYVFDLAFQRIQ